MSNYFIPYFLCVIRNGNEPSPWGEGARRADEGPAEAIDFIKRHSGLKLFIAFKHIIEKNPNSLPSDNGYFFNEKECNK